MAVDKDMVKTHGDVSAGMVETHGRVSLRDQMMLRIAVYATIIMIMIGTNGCGVPPDRTNIQAIDYVNVFTGTSNSRWMLGPYASLPFGMVQLGPDNQGTGWMDGYEYAINSVSGFSHLHAWTMGGLLCMPQTVDLVTDERPVDAPYKGAQAGYHSRIEKETEIASPGYYEVFLYDSEVLAQMTVTPRCGFQQYTFPKKNESRILIDLQIPSEYRYKVLEGSIKQVSATELEGYALSNNGYADYTLHFVIRFDKPFMRMGGWNNRKKYDDVKEVKGEGDVGVYVVFETADQEVIKLQSGLSMVSIDHARMNLRAELDSYDWNFDQVKAAAQNTWNDLLGKIAVKGGSELNKKKFYTNMYRAYCAKQTWNDVDGSYIDPCGNLQKAPTGVSMYGGDAFWNSFWNLNILWSIVSPDIVNNWVSTQLELYKNSGWTSKGPTGLIYTGIMIGNHEMSLMASAYQKGIRKDGEAIYEAMRKNVMVQANKEEVCGNPGNEELNTYRKYGYIPYTMGRTSNALDYTFDDWTVAQMAKALGKDDDYEFLMKGAENYKNLLHPETKWMTPKDPDSLWKSDFDLFSNKGFVEGNSWQYLWYVPHDIPGLIDILGVDLFNKRLEEGFEKSVEHKFAAHAFDRSEGQRAELYINHGNEVNMQAAWLFNLSGKPWLTQKYTRAIMDSYYGSTPYHGWEGDEDEGQMGAWFVISAMGLFEMNGAADEDPVLELSSPLFEEIVIHLDEDYYSGKTFTIRAENFSEGNIYIQSARLNGVEYGKSNIRFSEVAKGGELVYVMGEAPGAWGEDRLE